MNGLPLGLVIFALILGGCASQVPADSEEAEPAAIPSPSTFSREYAGTVYYRLPGDTPPFGHYEGDTPTACFNVPEGTTRVDVAYQWNSMTGTPDVPQEMVLQVNPLHDYDARVETSGGGGRLDVTVENPPEGTWFFYAGPGIAGGAFEWFVELSFSNDLGATVEQTEYDGEPCY